MACLSSSVMFCSEVMVEVWNSLMICVLVLMNFLMGADIVCDLGSYPDGAVNGTVGLVSQMYNQSGPIISEFYVPVDVPLEVPIV